MNITVIPLISAIISLVFAVTVLDQFFARRKPYQLIWAMGLLMYFISTGAEFWVGIWGLNQVIYRLWYLFGAMSVAAYLGMGTLYLLARRRVANIIMAILLAASVYAAFRVFTASIDLNGLYYLSVRVIPQEMRLMTPFFNTFGTIALVGGALYSARVFWRHRVMSHRVVSNSLIAAGAMLAAAGGMLERFGVSPIIARPSLELVGIIILFAGFLRSREILGFYRFPLIHGFSKASVD
ncbi:MAG: hypothetical protein HYY80_04925 [Chloroflexi bacterium]|nr:hypothetical protein [Chloroflexota bacterium]MBI3930718.1 hypothetical protein [Chloroflexota bacterium]